MISHIVVSHKSQNKETNISFIASLLLKHSNPRHILDIGDWTFKISNPKWILDIGF